MVIALTRHGQSEIERVGFGCWYAPHGVDTKTYYPDEIARQEGKKKLGWEDKFIIGTVGVNYSDDRKNLSNLLLAFKWFHERHDDARLYLAVNPLHSDKNDTLTREMYNLDLAELIQWAEPDQYFLGRVGDGILANRYRMLDVFCMPTKGEGFGLPLIESQACGTPVLTTDASTGPELCPTQYLMPVPDHEWEWFNKEWRPSLSAKSIMEGLEKVYNDKNLRKVGQDGCKFVQDYDWDILHDKYWRPILKEIEGFKTKVKSIPAYNDVLTNGRITMDDCSRWCERKCVEHFPLLYKERESERHLISRSYPVIPDKDGNLMVETECPLHNWLSTRFKNEVKEAWNYLWGFPKVRQMFRHSELTDKHILLDDIKVDFDDEYKWAMQSIYYTDCPDLSKYMNGGKVLEVGCGDGKRVKALLDKGVDAVGIEINPAHVNGYVKLGDAENLDYPDNSFGVVYSVDVLEHLSEPLRAISEMFRVSSGIVISVLTPTGDGCFLEDPTHKVGWHWERWKREINEFGDIIDIMNPFTVVARKR